MTIIIAVGRIFSYKNSTRIFESFIETLHGIAESVFHRCVAAAEKRDFMAFQIKRSGSISEIIPIVCQFSVAMGGGTKDQNFVVAELIWCCGAYIMLTKK